MAIKELKPLEDEFSGKIVALMEEYNIKTFLLSGVDAKNAGVTSMQFEDTNKGVTALALLMRAVPQLFLMMEEMKLGAYVSMITNMLQASDTMGAASDGDGGTALDDFIVKGKLKN